MNDITLTVNFIKALIKKTAEGKLDWEYLDAPSNDLLAYELGLETSYGDGDIYDHESAFSLNLDDQNVSVVILTQPHYPAPRLHIIPNTGKNMLSIYEPTYISALTELLNTIKRQFPNPYDFMEQFIKD